MADWFSDNAPEQSQDWFSQNAPTPPPIATVNPESDQETFLNKVNRIAQAPSPEWLQPAEARAKAFVQGIVPTSLDEIKQALLRSPIQDVQDIYGDVSQIPERLRNFGETLQSSPAATVARAPFSPEAFRVYGTTVGMIAPGLFGKSIERPSMEIPVQEPPLSAAMQEQQASALQNTLTPQVEPFPSILQSAEDARRIQLQQPEIPPADVPYTGQQPPPENIPAVGANVKGFEQTYGTGEIPAGETVTPEDAWNAAAARAQPGQAKPYDFVDRAKTGAITPEELADLIYEHQQLLNRAGAAEGTAQYAELAGRAKAFAENVLKPAENAWHRSGQTMQIAVRPDYSSLTGIQNAAIRMGREIQASELAEARRIANENKAANNGVQSNGQKLLQAMDREYSRGARTRVKSAEELRNQLAGTDPCVLI